MESATAPNAKKSSLKSPPPPTKPSATRLAESVLRYAATRPVVSLVRVPRRLVRLLCSVVVNPTTGQGSLANCSRRLGGASEGSRASTAVASHPCLLPGEQGD